MKMMMAIVQAEDVSKISRALVEAGYRVTQISTTGGLLRRDNATLLLGVEDERVEDALNVFRKLGQHREADSAVAATAGAAPHVSHKESAESKAHKSKIVIGSATIFMLNVDQFERF